MFLNALPFHHPSLPNPLGNMIPNVAIMLQGSCLSEPKPAPAPKAFPEALAEAFAYAMASPQGAVGDLLSGLSTLLMMLLGALLGGGGGGGGGEDDCDCCLPTCISGVYYGLG